MRNQFQQQLEKLQQNKQYLLMLVFLLVIVVVWTVVGIFSSQKKVAIPPELRELAKPLTPLIDKTIFEELKNKKYYSQSDLRSFPIFKIVATKDGSKAKLVEIDYEGETLDADEPPPPATIVTPEDQASESAQANPQSDAATGSTQTEDATTSSSKL